MFLLSKLPRLDELRSDYTIVGITGHCDLSQDATINAQLRSRIKEKLGQFQQEGSTLCLLCPMAPGADQLVMEVAQGLKIPVTMLLPMPLPDYQIESFAEPEYAASYASVTAFVQDHHDRVIYLANKDSEATDAKLTATERKERLVALAAVIADYSDHLLALWDGVDSGKDDGGTSHVVHMALSGVDSEGKPLARVRKRKGRLHHLITPRVSNPFPLSARHRSTGRPFTSLPSLGELTWDMDVTFPLKPDKPDGWQRFWRKARRLMPFFTSFWIPLGLVVLSTSLGYQGFLQQRQYATKLEIKQAIWKREFNDFSYGLRERKIETRTQKLISEYEWPAWLWEWNQDVLFEAANLNTLNSSVLRTDLVSPYLIVGRWMGLAFLTYAFVLAFVLAVGSERQHQIRFWWIRTRLYRRLINPRRFSLVIGMNDRAFNLIVDLRRKKIPVVVLTTEAESPYRESCVNRGVIYLTGSPFVTASLRKAKFGRAECVYVMGDSEEENIRTVQEMDQLWQKLAEPTPEKHWYVQLQSAMLADFLLHSFRKKPEVVLHVFNLYETIARRQLLNFPIDRFYPRQPGTPVPDTAQVAIFGFGPMGQTLALACLRLGHFPGGKQLRIRVYAEGAADAQRRFEQQYPCLSTLHDTPYHRGLTRTVRDSTFWPDVLTFDELPVSAGQLLNPDFSLFGMVNNHTALSVYCCLDNVMQSAGVLGTLLPRLHYLRQPNGNQPPADVQVFGFYNLPDEDEVNHVVHQLNALATRLPVSFFGNFLRECTGEAIRNRALDALGTEINWYYLSDEQRATTFKIKAEAWQDQATSEENRESSRQAGDHLWVKLRYALYQLAIDPEDWREVQKKIKTELATYDAGKDASDKLMHQLSELEHTRWNAEKLLLGYVALQDTADGIRYSPDELKARWDALKETYKAQRIQLDLVPFDQLSDKERAKDRAQVKHMPDYLSALLKFDEATRRNSD